MTPTTPNTTTNESSSLPYLACPVHGVSMEIQQKIQLLNSYFLRPLNLTLAICSFLAKVLLIVAVMRLRATAHPSLTLFCSLSASDLMWTLLQFYGTLADYFGIYYCSPRRLRVLTVPLRVISICGTLSNLVIISIDRFRAISRPLWYRSHMTQSRALKDVFISWLITGIVATLLVAVQFPSVFQPTDIILLSANIISPFYFAACCSVIIASHFKMYKASKDQWKNLPQCNAQQAAAARLREKKVAKTVSFLLIAFVFTHVPSFAIPLILYLTRQRRMLELLVLFYSIFMTLNGLMNPLIYFKRNESMQRSLRELFRCRSI